MKKFVSMLLALVMVFALCACGSKTEDGDKAESIKVGFICLHDENSTYDKNFIDAAKAACKNAGLSEDQYIIKTNIPEGQECYNAAAELVDAGCNVVFADSFGHEDFMIQAAKGTAEKIAEVTKQLEDGTLHVFDTSTFTVKGETLTSYMADVDTDADNAGDTEAISDGYFHESEFRAAPYFNVQIDGINLLDQNFGS